MSSHFATDGYYIFLDRERKIHHRKIDDCHPCPNLGMEIPPHHPDGGHGEIALATAMKRNAAYLAFELARLNDTLDIPEKTEESRANRDRLDAALTFAFAAGQIFRFLAKAEPVNPPEWNGPEDTVL